MLGSRELHSSIENTGVLQFGTWKGVHRPFFIDFNTENLFGEAHPPLAQAAMRTFIASNPATNRKHPNAVCGHLDSNKGRQKMLNVKAMVDKNDACSNHRMAESLDNIVHQKAESGKKKCQCKEKDPKSKATQLERTKQNVLS